MANQHIHIGEMSGRNIAFGTGANAGDRLAQPEYGAPSAERSQPTNADRVSVRMGFALDVAGYSDRPATAKEDAQRRVAAMVDHVMTSLAVSTESCSRQDAGDGIIVFLPSDVEIHRALPTLIRECTIWLASDNQRYRDRLRLRLAVVVGPVGPARLGFSGDTVIECGRLVDSEPVRALLHDREDVDLAVIISDHLYAFVVSERHPGLEPEQFHKVRVHVKEFEADGWLWTGLRN